MIGHHLRRAHGRLRWYTDSDHGLAALLVLLTLYVFVVYPLDQGDPLVGGIASVAFSLILVAGVVATATHHAVRLGVVIVALIGLTTHWSNVVLSGRVDHMVSAAAAVVFFATQTWFLLQRVFATGTVNAYRIMGAIAAYIVLGLLWANAYTLVYLIDPAAFQFSTPAAGEPPTSEMLYFSFVTLTTVGYGDITAVNPIARSLVMLQALVGQLYPAVLLARLVTEYQGRPKPAA
jgi:hypothetical protein